MLPVPISALPTVPRTRSRTALVASADSSFRQRLTETLGGLRWQVREAESGAQAWSAAEETAPEAVILDSWLPDLDLTEFIADFRGRFPQTDLITAGGASKESPRGPFRQELLYALRRCQDTDTAAWNTAADRLPELIGNSPSMLEVSRRIRLVAPRLTPVLIEGPTGSGKELVAEALHRLSTRSRKPFVAINCAAIPEALLEAELFGHTRGAFTGAVQGRVGRIESADGGTLFLDEIGEMPLALQSKLLRFVESSELQRIGRQRNHQGGRAHRCRHAPAAGRTHQDGQLPRRPLLSAGRVPHSHPGTGRASPGSGVAGRALPRKDGTRVAGQALGPSAMAKLAAHDWPGNVRELEHVLERASILAGDESTLTAAEIDFGLSVN
jgi:DNA-binding NtrC family response regulator